MEKQLVPNVVPNLKDKILKLMKNDNLYSIGLDIGLFESTLRKILYGQKVNEKTIQKLTNYFEGRNGHN